MVGHCFPPTANIRTKILDFRGFVSSIILILRGGILMSIGNFLESLSQRRDIYIYIYMYLYIYIYMYRERERER